MGEGKVCIDKTEGVAMMCVVERTNGHCSENIRKQEQMALVDLKPLTMVLSCEVEVRLPKASVTVGR